MHTTRELAECFMDGGCQPKYLNELLNDFVIKEFVLGERFSQWDVLLNTKVIENVFFVLRANSDVWTRMETLKWVSEVEVVEIKLLCLPWLRVVGEDVEEGRFARSRRTDESDDFSLVYGHVETF